jgi:hypothetical protein
MRGRFQDQGGLFSYIRPEERIPADHPLREIRKLVREVLKELSHNFGKLYSHEGRPSIPPEQLLSALLLQVFYGLRSERQLMEQLNYNLLFRWFVGLSPDDPVWDGGCCAGSRRREDACEAVGRRRWTNAPRRMGVPDKNARGYGAGGEAWPPRRSGWQGAHRRRPTAWLGM